MHALPKSKKGTHTHTADGVCGLEGKFLSAGWQRSGAGTMRQGLDAKLASSHEERPLPMKRASCGPQTHVSRMMGAGLGLQGAPLQGG